MHETERLFIFSSRFHVFVVLDRFRTNRASSSSASSCLLAAGLEGGIPAEEGPGVDGSSAVLTAGRRGLGLGRGLAVSVMSVLD